VNPDPPIKCAGNADVARLDFKPTLGGGHSASGCGGLCGHSCESEKKYLLLKVEKVEKVEDSVPPRYLDFFDFFDF
jgi:hypothetical protein